MSQILEQGTALKNLPENQEPVQDIESQIYYLAEEGGIDLGHLSTERRKKLVDRLGRIQPQAGGCYPGKAHGPG